MKLYKWLAKIFLFVVPSLIAIILLISNQEPKVAWGFGGILLSLIIFVSTLKKVGDWVKRKEQSHDTATNLGNVSHTTPFLALEIVKFSYYSFPIAILIWIDVVFANYQGSVGKVLGFVVLSYAASGIFNYLYLKSQQVNIQEETAKTKQDEMAALKTYLAESD